MDLRPAVDEEFSVSIVIRRYSTPIHTTTAEVLPCLFVPTYPT